MKKKPVAQHRIMNVGVAALAREIGVSEATVSKKMKAGKTADQIRSEAAQRKGIAPPNTKGPGRAPAKKSEYEMIIKSRSRYDDMEEAKLRRQKALADRQEIENMLRRGELLPVSYVRKWASRLLVEAKDELLRTPSELADTLAAETDAVQVATILRTAQERALAKLEQLKKIWQGDLDAEQVA
jgi:hypothetical protein